MGKLTLLIWKNLILRRRQWIVTSLEILLPVVLFIAAGYANAEVGAGGGSGSGASVTPTIFPKVEEEGLKKFVKCSASSRGGPPPANCIIAFTPENVETQDVIDKLKTCLSTPTTIDFKGFKSEVDIETFVAGLNSDPTAPSQSLKAALVFDEGLGSGGSGGGPFSYKILWEGKALVGRPLFPISQEPGPNELNVGAYGSSGFIGLQLCTDKSLMEKLTGKLATQSVSLQAFPYPPYKSPEGFNQFYFNFIPSLFNMAFVFMVPSITKAVVGEKATGIKELLKLNGLRGWLQWLGWMINSILILMISVTIVVILLYMDFGGGAGIYRYGDPIICWVVLLLYIMSATTYSFFVCSFFSKPELATTCGLILWFGLYQFPLNMLEKIYDTSPATTKMAFAIFPSMGVHLALRVMGSFEAKATGTQWSNIADPISESDSLSMLHIIVMMLLDTVIYMLLTIYLENVLPSEFGVRQPFYYIFKPGTYLPGGVSNKVGDSEAAQDKAPTAPGFEEETSTAPVGVDVRNLRKNFGAYKAVDGVSMKMYHGEIFALLGHNGAGKTTTISMMTGMFAPSSGTAIVNGYDISKSLAKARDYLGLCPQHNMLFDKLTVAEHLQFFGKLKGLSSKAVSNEINELLPKLQLVEKRNTMSKDLAGGQKRKLSLGIALIGGSKVVILDEPTSGMDPEARRVIWDLLLEMRGERTILLTTHFMEEADVLGDRIGIMAAGKLQCCGSSMFLKKFYGAGYILKLSVTEGAKSDAIVQHVQKYIPDAAIKANRSKKSTELMITLPTETTTTAVLSEMFTDLSKHKEQLGIETVGLSLTSIDEVFLRVGEISEGHDHVHDAKEHVVGSKSSKSMVSTADKSTDPRSSRSFSKPNDGDNKEVSKNEVKEVERQGIERLVGSKLATGQFLSLLTKKRIYACRKWKGILLQLIIPIALLSLTIWMTRQSFTSKPPSSPLKISVDSYSNLVTLVSSSDPMISLHFPTVIGTSYKEVSGGTSLSQALLDAGTKNLGDYREKYIVALEGTSTNFNAMFNTIPNHGAPLAINLASNVLLKSLALASNSTSANNLQINVEVNQLGSKSSAYQEETQRNPSVGIILFGIFMPIGLGMLVSSFVVFPVEEKVCNAKQLQMMTGVSPLTYWYSAFAWDFFLVFLVICVMTICFPIFETNSLFTSNGGAVVAFVILAVYGISGIWFSYLLSLFTSSSSGAFGLVSLIHTITGTVMSLIVFGLETAGAAKKATFIMKWVGRILCPAYGAAKSTILFAITSAKNSKCNIISQEAKTFLCDPTRSIAPKYRSCCANCKDLPGVTCFKPEPYFIWKGIGIELLLMVVMTFVYQTILMMLECRIIQRLCTGKGAAFVDNVTDEDVVTEKRRIEEMVKNGSVDEDALVVDNLCKNYGSFSAVSKLTFGVHHGECFGLLGVNGAGKTTTFRMLTGDELRTCGNAYAFRKTLEKNRQEFLSNIGYCPQFDGIIGVLSGKQMLQLFGGLRGVPKNIIDSEADKWLEKMGLSGSANVQCQKYSGGMKRRLGVAMAAIGDPPLLFLDEPTSGVDPVSRRQFWDVLGAIRDAGQAIILTSHSMDECETLCSRLAIMVNGQMQCLGGVQHLKSKFAQGYSLDLKLKPMVPPESEELANMKKEIMEKFHPCTLKDMHLNAFLYQLQNTNMAWDVLFTTMEEIKTKYDAIIEDYSLNETSLEEVFLSFARNQYGDRTVKDSKLKRCLKCSGCF